MEIDDFTCRNYWQEKPIAHLVHKQTNTCLSVYSKIGWFKRLMLRLCFGLKYEKIN